MKYDIVNYAFPMIAKNKSNTYRLLGSSIVLNSQQQHIITCAHVLSLLKDEETLFLNVHGTQELYALTDFVVDDKMDIAVASLKMPEIRLKSAFALDSIEKIDVEIKCCEEIMSFGFITSGIMENLDEIRAQAMKGYITWYSDKPLPKIGANSSNISSYSNPKGFSGGPVVLSSTAEFFGISFNNLISEEPVFELLEVHKNGFPVYKEVKSRIVENGTFHSVKDITYFLCKNGILKKTLIQK